MSLPTDRLLALTTWQGGTQVSGRDGDRDRWLPVAGSTPTIQRGSVLRRLLQSTSCYEWFVKSRCNSNSESACPRAPGQGTGDALLTQFLKHTGHPSACQLTCCHCDDEQEEHEACGLPMTGTPNSGRHRVTSGESSCPRCASRNNRDDLAWWPETLNPRHHCQVDRPRRTAHHAQWNKQTRQ